MSYNIKSYDQKKIGGTSVTVDQNTKIGSVRGRYYCTLDSFGLAGLPQPIGTPTLDPITHRAPIEAVFKDVTIYNSKEFPFSKPEGEPYLQKVGSQFKGKTPSPVFPTKEQGKFAMRKDNPFNEESVFRNGVASSNIPVNPNVLQDVVNNIETSANEIPPDDNDFFAELLEQREKLRKTVTVEKKLFPQFAEGKIVPAQDFVGLRGVTPQFSSVRLSDLNPADIKNIIRKSGGKSVSQAVARDTGSSNITDDELNRERALGVLGRKNRIISSKLKIIPEQRNFLFTSGGFEASGSQFTTPREFAPKPPSPTLSVSSRDSGFGGSQFSL